MDAFLSWLSGISFSGGGFSEAAICEGLSEALMVLTSSQNITFSSVCFIVLAHIVRSKTSVVYIVS
jgi:hypothetical protein